MEKPERSDFVQVALGYLKSYRNAVIQVDKIRQSAIILDIVLEQSIIGKENSK